MSNFRLLNPDCVFIHIPKTGGTSIRRGVWGSQYVGPMYGEIPAEWDGLWRFAFVRHPLERLMSAWDMACRKQVYGPPVAQTIEAFLAVVMDDDIPHDYKSPMRTEGERIRHHTIPQTHPFNCLEAADFVGRFEHFQRDYTVVAKRMGITSRDLPHMYPATQPRQWSDVLSGECLQHCVDYYRRDFEQLGYELPANH